MTPHVDRHDDLRQAQDVRRRDRDAGASQRIHASEQGAWGQRNDRPTHRVLHGAVR